MGGAMAERLLDSGFPLVICDPDRERLGPLTDRGAVAAATPREVADRAEIVFACLPSPEISRTVAIGADGVASGKAVKIYIESSTIGQATVIAIEEALAARGISTLDMPVSGGPIWARDGKLIAILSGPPAAREAASPVLARLAGRVMVVGDRAGLGQVAKVVNNALSLTGMMIACEAIVAGVKAGLDARTLIDVINASTGRNSATADKFPKAILPRTFVYGGPIVLGNKDLEMYLELGRTTQASTALGQSVAELWKTITAEIGSERDLSEMVRYFEAIAGVEVRGRGMESPQV
jgi:3-hydroxyisobutyrate dehydrogenase-like beta-hydroxyacid dehydrogenase